MIIKVTSKKPEKAVTMPENLLPWKEGRDLDARGNPTREKLGGGVSYSQS